MNEATLCLPQFCRRCGCAIAQVSNARIVHRDGVISAANREIVHAHCANYRIDEADEGGFYIINVSGEHLVAHVPTRAKAQAYMAQLRKRIIAAERIIAAASKATD